MKMERYLGFILLFSGLCVIAFSAVYAYKVFSGAHPVPGLFELQPVEMNMNVPQSGPVRVQVLSGENGSRVLNMSMWYLLMLFFVSVGARVSGLGIKLLSRPIDKEKSPG